MKQKKLRKPLSLLLALALVLTMFAGLSITAFASETVSYLSPVYNTAGNASSGVKEWQTLNCENCTKLTAGGTGSSGWYYVEGTVTLTDRLYCDSGDLNIILKDGSELKWSGNASNMIKANGGSITIYTQSHGDNQGKITFSSNVSSGQVYAYNSIIINGGHISCTGESSNFVWDAYRGSFVVNEGEISLACTSDASSVLYSSYGAITVNGGSVTAESSSGHVANFGNNTTVNAKVEASASEDGSNATVLSDPSTISRNTSYKYARFTVAPSYSLTGASSLSGQGGVTFKVNGTEVTEAKPGATVTATATALDGYTAALSSSDVTISNGTFTMPSKAVTVTATYTELATSGSFDLDLESDTETPSSTTIDQYYIRTTADKTTVNNKIKVSWVNQSIGIKVAAAKKWNPTTLNWDTDSDKNGKASVAEGTNVTTFTFTNYSTKAFTIEPTFAINSALSDTVKGSLTSATYDQDSYTVAKVDMKDDTVAADKYFNEDGTVNESALPSASVVATLNMDATKFDGASATSSAQKYGTYTFTLNAVSEN